MIVQLWRLECHECGRPADWWVDGATLPCCCGVRDRPHLDQVIELVTARLQHGQAAPV